MTWSDAAATGSPGSGPESRPRLWRSDLPGLLSIDLENSAAAWKTLQSAGRELTGDVRAVIIRLAGRQPATESDGMLADGYDPAWGALSESACDAVLDDFQDAFRWLQRNDLISIAVVTGALSGPGVHAALACDLRFLAADSSMAFVETSQGLVPALTGSAALVALAGLDRALELCLTGRTADAREAERLGLATRVVAEGELAATVDAFVAGLLALPREAAAETKALLTGAPGRSRREQEAAERAALGRRLRDLAGTGE